HGGGGPRARPQGQVQWFRGPGAVSPHRHPRQPLRPLLCAGRYQACLRRSRGVGQGRTSASPEEGGDGMSGVDIGALLERLGLSLVNPGSWSGSHGWSGSTDVPLLNVRNPADGTPLAQVRPAGEQDYEHVLSSAVEAAAAWREVPAPKRGEAVRLLGEQLRRHKSDLGTLVSLENGKILAEGLGEVQEMIDIADFAVGQSRMLYGLTMHSERPRHRMAEQWHPLGVVGIISAFNFPVAVWSWNAFLGVVCGNACVWKPSHKTPLTALAVQRLCNTVVEANHLPPIFQLFVETGTELATRFVADRRVALISFTGSTEVGRKVGERVAARLGKSLLELGGNNAVIVDETANLDLAVPAIVFGAVGTAGQRCTSTRRVFAHQAIAAELERRLIHAYRQVRIGDPLQSETLMGPLIDAHALSSALFTDRLQNAEAFLSAAGSDCGIANINLGTSGAEIGGAFGGEKDSGGGRESGSDAWKAYMRRQTATVNWSRELPLAQGIEFKVAQ